MKPGRKKTSLKNRLTPCQCCSYPISQTHHLLDIATYGDNNFTYQLCANCHELYHLIEQVSITGDTFEAPRTRSGKLFKHILKTWDADYINIMVKIRQYGIEIRNKADEYNSAIYPIFQDFFESIITWEE